MKSRKLSMLGQHQRLKKEAHCKIKARLGYKLSLSPAWTMELHHKKDDNQLVP